MPETSIILVPSNNLYEATVPCLDSIFRHTGNEDYEVNARRRQFLGRVAGYLTELARRESRLCCVLKENSAYGTLPDIRGIASSIS